MRFVFLVVMIGVLDLERKDNALYQYLVKRTPAILLLSYYFSGGKTFMDAVSVLRRESTIC